MVSIHNFVEKNSEHDLLITNIRKLMQTKGITEAELSRGTQIPQATVHKILAGKTEDPRASTLKTLSDFFGISIDELLTGVVTPAGAVGAEVQSIPVISWKECVKAGDFTAKLTPTNWGQWVVSEFLGENVYALSTKPSMAPRFPKGTTLFINPDVDPADGDHVVVLYSGTDEATLREFSIDGPTKLLLPINPNTDATKLDKNVKILGVLVKSSFSY